jgi:hypothetical protein
MSMAVGNGIFNVSEICCPPRRISDGVGRSRECAWGGFVYLDSTLANRIHFGDTHNKIWVGRSQECAWGGFVYLDSALANRICFGDTHNKICLSLKSI